METYKTDILVLLIAAISIWLYFRKSRQKRQLKFIQNYRVPKPIIDRFREKYPKLSSEDANLTSKALMDYFYICNMAHGKMVSMPSRVVDDLWHEFLLFSKSYEKFSKKGFARLLHHIPEEAMPNKNSDSDGMKIAWQLICKKENIHPKHPNKMPLLFAIDSILEIENGLKYSLNKTFPGNLASPPSSTSESGVGYAGYFVDDFNGAASYGDDAGGAGCGGSGCGGS